MKNIIFILFILFSICIFTQAFAQEEITLSTYYPAPYGEYRTLAIGDNYTAPIPLNPPAPDIDLVVEGRVGIGMQQPNWSLGMEVDPVNSPSDHPYPVDGICVTNTQDAGASSVICRYQDASLNTSWFGIAKRGPNATFGGLPTEGDAVIFNGGDQSSILFAQNDIDAMRIASDGYVGIHVRTPLNYLQIGGNMLPEDYLIHPDEAMGIYGQLCLEYPRMKIDNANGFETSTGNFWLRANNGEGSAMNKILFIHRNGANTSESDYCYGFYGNNSDYSTDPTYGGPAPTVTIGEWYTSGGRTSSMLSVRGGVSVGDGYVATKAPDNGMLIEGTVGIGTTTPTAKLEVSAATNQMAIQATGNTNASLLYCSNTGAGQAIRGDSTSGTAIRGATSDGMGIYGQATGSGAKAVYGLATDSSGIGGYFENSALNGVALCTGPNGDVGFGTSVIEAHALVHIDGNLYVNGNIEYTGNLINSCSIRWKENVKPIENALEKTLKLQGVTFDWKETKKHDIGLIAEEVGKVLPEAVTYEDNGVDARGLDYNPVVAVLVEAVKELKIKNEELEKRVAALENKI
ncbi:MAG: tail fiber domain-containing protein [Candidatus Omnitrophota bacterium]